ncbi:PPC domain-containing DNA-binding protein [Rhizobium pisi]|uniref:PPC domain-containing DNA-binding protein n=1 Tax=Rhizobium pisi TaxID=574561 RepID=UPI0039B0CE0E
MDHLTTAREKYASPSRQQDPVKTALARGLVAECRDRDPDSLRHRPAMPSSTEGFSLRPSSASSICSIVTRRHLGGHDDRQNNACIGQRERDRFASPPGKADGRRTHTFAMLSGFGFAGQITFGFFDFEAREYKPKTYENLEVTNLTGSLAWKEGKPLPHLHVTAGSSSFAAVCGHPLALEVGRRSMEINVMTLPDRLEPIVDASIAVHVLQLGPAG